MTVQCGLSYSYEALQLRRRIRSPHHPQFSFVLFVTLLVSDGNITDDVFTVQIGGQEDGERFKSVFHWDMKSKDEAAAPNRQPLVDEVRRELETGLEAEKRMTRCADDMCSQHYFARELVKLSSIHLVIPAVYKDLHGLFPTFSRYLVFPDKLSDKSFDNLYLVFFLFKLS